MKCFMVKYEINNNDCISEKTFFLNAENEYAAGTCAIAGECRAPAKFVDKDEQTIHDSYDIIYTVMDVKEVEPKDVATIGKYCDIYDYEPKWVERVAKWVPNFRIGDYVECINDDGDVCMLGDIVDSKHDVDGALLYVVECEHSKNRVPYRGEKISKRYTKFDKKLGKLVPVVNK